MTIFKEFGTVKRLGSEVPIHDWKSAVHEVIKPTGQWHFKLSLCKRIILTKDIGEILVCEVKCTTIAIVEFQVQY